MASGLASGQTTLLRRMWCWYGGRVAKSGGGRLFRGRSAGDLRIPPMWASRHALRRV